MQITYFKSSLLPFALEDSVFGGCPVYHWFTYKQNGSSMVVHSFINSMEPPGSADTSQIATSRLGRLGVPGAALSQGVEAGISNDLASGRVINRGV